MNETKLYKADYVLFFMDNHGNGNNDAADSWMRILPDTSCGKVQKMSKYEFDSYMSKTNANTLFSKLNTSFEVMFDARKYDGFRSLVAKLIHYAIRKCGSMRHFAFVGGCTTIETRENRQDVTKPSVTVSLDIPSWFGVRREQFDEQMSLVLQHAEAERQVAVAARVIDSFPCNRYLNLHLICSSADTDTHMCHAFAVKRHITNAKIYSLRRNADVNDFRPKNFYVSANDSDICTSSSSTVMLNVQKLDDIFSEHVEGGLDVSMQSQHSTASNRTI